MHNFSIQLLQSVLELVLVLEDGHFVFFLDGQLHFSHLQGLLKLMALRLQVLPSFLFLASSLVTLVQIATQILNLLLLLPEDLSQLIRRMPHVLQHVCKLVH